LPIFPSARDEISILHFSDTHIHHSSDFKENIFLKAVDMINNLKVDYVIHTGDITGEGTREDYELAQKLMSKINKKIIYILGNHDARNVGYELFDDYFGPIKDFFADENILIAGFDTTIPDRDGGRFGASSIHALKRIVNENGQGRLKVVAFHHHLLPVPGAGRERSMIADAGDVLETILDYGVNLVLNGHRHAPNIYRIENTMVVNSGTLSHYKTRAGGSHSFNIINISSEGRYNVKVINIESSDQKTIFRRIEKKDKLIPADERRLARIVQISDTHFSDSSDFLPKIYNLAVKKINQLCPDLVIHCGDVTDDGLIDSFKLARKQLRKILAPKLIIPGPHDLQNLGQLLFQKRIGEFNPVYKGPDGRFTVYGVNSSQYDDMEGRIGRSHLIQIIKNLSGTNRNSVKIVVFHHHVLPLPHTREKYPIEDAGDVLKQLCDMNVDMILTGHRHVTNLQKIDETIVVNANTLSSQRVQARYGNTFNLVDILSNGTAIISDIGVATGIRRITGVYTLPSISIKGND
jgi:putative phosphoesterase